MKPILLLAALSLPVMAAEPNTLTAEEKADGFKLLFDGKSLRNFRNFKKEDVNSKWQVKDGTITLTEKGGGDLITDKEFADFEFRFEFKIAPNGNSGIMWRVTEDAGATFESGPEYQILDSHATDGYKHETSKGNVAGALYDLVPGSREPFKGPDEWNEGSIIIKGTKITLTLNGTVTADVDTSTDEWKELLGKSKFATWGKFNKFSKGHIAFQDHGDVVSFRSLRIKKL